MVGVHSYRAIARLGDRFRRVGRSFGRDLFYLIACHFLCVAVGVGVVWDGRFLRLLHRVCLLVIPIKVLFSVSRYFGAYTMEVGYPRNSHSLYAFVGSVMVGVGLGPAFDYIVSGDLRFARGKYYFLGTFVTYIRWVRGANGQVCLANVPDEGVRWRATLLAWLVGALGLANRLVYFWCASHFVRVLFLICRRVRLICRRLLGFLVGLFFRFLTASRGTRVRIFGCRGNVVLRRRFDGLISGLTRVSLFRFFGVLGTLPA